MLCIKFITIYTVQIVGVSKTKLTQDYNLILSQLQAKEEKQIITKKLRTNLYRASEN